MAWEKAEEMVEEGGKQRDRAENVAKEIIHSRPNAKELDSTADTKI
jgi:hypothetical protein